MNEDTLKLYDLLMIKKAAHGNHSLVVEMVNTYVASSEYNRNALLFSEQNKDFETRTSTAHKLKTGIDLLAIQSLKIKIRQIEKPEFYSLHPTEISKLVREVYDKLWQIELLLKEEFSLAQ